MKASKLKSFWIILQSIWIVFTTSLIILLTPKNRKARKKIDYLARNMSTKLLHVIRLAYTIFDPYHLQLDPNRCYIVMCNHTSHYDIPLSFITIHGSLRMIAKKELFRVPIWGTAMKKAEFLSLDRNDKEEAKRVLADAKKKMESGIIIWIAPEGTRSKTGKLQPFKKGGFMLAYQMNAMIIPLGIRGAFKLLPSKTLNFHTHEKAEVHIGKPIDTSAYKIKDRALLMKAVEDSIRELAQL